MIQTKEVAMLGSSFLSLGKHTAGRSPSREASPDRVSPGGAGRTMVSLRKPTRDRLGTNAWISSSRFEIKSGLRICNPVRLPPGRARLATRPATRTDALATQGAMTDGSDRS